MTLIRRLTMMLVGWIVVILAVFNIIFLARIQTQAYSTLRNTLRLEVVDAWHLNQQVPHLSVTNSAWEDAALVIPSTIRFYNAKGQVTSSGTTEGFPDDAFGQALAGWMPTLKSSVRSYTMTMSTSESNQIFHGATAIPFGGDSETARQPEPESLTEVSASGPNSHRFVGVEQPFLYPDGSVGVIVAAATTRSVEDAVFNALHGLLWTDAPVILIVALGTYVVTARGLRHIPRLIEAIRGLQWSSISRIHVTEGSYEIQTLANTVNQLLDRVDNGVREQRRFIADASHELRTPLAIIAGHANLLRRWGSTKPEVWEPAVHHIVSEVGRLQALADNLLVLSRSEGSEQSAYPSITAPELRELLEELRNDGAVLSPDIVWQVCTQLDDNVLLSFTAPALRQVLVALMDNAIKHTLQGKSIALRAVMVDDEVNIQVADFGEGIPPEDLPFVFERFYRGKRSRGRQESGSGLGLAIAKQLVEAHGARMTIDSEVGIGTTVTIHAPVIPMPGD